MAKPLISIITVTYNAERVLENTILSVTGQTASDHIEYIIVDGASKDGTTDIIRKYEPYISKWVSEPDKGVYDAMNKGINMATGDYLWFVNAGDTIHAPDTLEKILKNCAPDADIYYGETEIVSEDGEIMGMRRLSAPEQLDWKSFQMGMLVCHQSIIVKRALAGQYNITYRIAADIDWVIAALRKSNKIVNTHFILSRFAKGGLSHQNVRLALNERLRIMVKNYGFFNTVLNHIRITIRFIRHYLFNK